MTNGYSKEDLIIVSVPTADQVSVMISAASLIAESNLYQDAGRKSSIGDAPMRKISTSSIEKKVSFDRGVSIQEEDDTKEPEKEELVKAPVGNSEETEEAKTEKKAEESTVAETSTSADCGI